MQMNTVELNIDKYESMLKELGVLKTENEELKKLLQTSHNSDYAKCPCCGADKGHIIIQAGCVICEHEW